MTSEVGVLFLQALNAKNIRVKDNGWIEASCVLAKWLHQKHHDHSPSFGLSIQPGARSYYSCFACRSGSAEELLQTLEHYAPSIHSYNFALCHQLLDQEEAVMPLPAYQEFAQTAHTFVEWPYYWLESFTPAQNRVESALYLADRGVPLPIVQKFDLRYDTKRSMIVAPYKDVYGRFAGARGRSILPDVTGIHKHYDYTYQNVNNNRLCWFNELVLNNDGPVVVVEGQFDCMRVAQVWPKVVANLSSKPTWEKMKKLGDSPFIIQIPDRDAAGQMSIGVYGKMCAQLGIGYKMLWLDEGAKDPGDCHPDYLLEKIQGVI